MISIQLSSLNIMLICAILLFIGSFIFKSLMEYELLKDELNMKEREKE